MATLSPADLERLRTWAVEIALTLLPDGTTHRAEGRETTFSKSGGLHIRDDGHWYLHAQACGHWSTVPLIERLKSCATADAEQWAVAWLSSHPGDGRCTKPTDSAEDDGLAFADYAQRLLDSAVAVDGTIAETYLREQRKIEPPYPDCVRFVPDVRAGEHGILGILTARGRVVGLQVGYLAPHGAKSLVLPNRRSFRLEKDGYPEGTFAVQVSDKSAGLQKTKPSLVACEGLENALSIAAATPAPWIVGIPGIGRLRHLPVSKGDRVVVFRDGDAKDSTPDKALTTGVDALLLAGATVTITATPEGDDANSILQKSGASMVAQLLREASAALAPQARLSLAGEITRLARLAPLDYALERRSAAKQLGITADVLDDEVKKASQPETAAAGEDIGASKAPKDEPWDDAVDLCAALDAGLKELQRYVVAKETTLAVAAIWPAHAHLLDNDMVRLQRSPRLKIESRTPGSGKTTLLEVVIALSPRGRILSGYSASSVMRSIAKRHPTLGLDEGDRGIAGNNDLVQIIDAGDRRHTALVTRSIKLPDGNWGEEELDVFGPMAIAGIDELPGTAEERCVRVFLLRARYSEIRGALRDGTSPELVDVRRHLTAWAAAQTDLPEPKLPEELTRRAPRTVSNWQSLLAIADVAGGRWPALIQQAVLEEINAEREPSKLEQLLRGIKAAFDAQSNVVEGDRRAADDKNRIQTKTLLSYLLQDTSEEWGRANRGRAITAYFLREKLRGLLNPAGAQEWETGTRSRGSRQSHHGYERHQFEDPWARYLPPPSPPSSSETSAGSAGLEKMAETRHSGTPGGGVETPADPETSAEQEPASDPADTANPADAAEIPIDPGRQSKPSPSNLDQEKSASGADLNGDTNDPADPADVSDGRGEGKPGSDIDLIRAAKIQNPKWGRSKLATELGVSERKVRAALAGWELPEEPPAAPPEQETA